MPIADAGKFAAVQREITRRCGPIEEEANQQRPDFCTSGRLEIAIRILDANAEVYLLLVDGDTAQQAYIQVLDEIGRKAFVNFSGMDDPIMIASYPDAVQAIRKRVGHWVDQGYGKYATPLDANSKQDGAEPESTQTPGNCDETERRERLLAEYKNATREPSNRSIYEAENSSIHKPEFYKWLNRDLPSDSATTINFERFLRSKKPPTPKHAKD